MRTNAASFLTSAPSLPCLLLPLPALPSFPSWPLPPSSHGPSLLPLPFASPSRQVASLKSLKRELENKVAELEDELDEANMHIESLDQVRPDVQYVDSEAAKCIN